MRHDWHPDESPATSAAARYFMRHRVCRKCGAKQRWINAKPDHKTTAAGSKHHWPLAGKGRKAWPQKKGQVGMNGALDWDGTAGECPSAWAEAALVLRKSSIFLWIVTRRKPTEPIAPRLIPDGIVDVIYCGRCESKKIHCEKLGLHFDFWIDNEPWLIAPELSLNTNVPSEEL